MIHTGIQFVYDTQTIFLAAVVVSSAYPGIPRMIFHFFQDFDNFLENYAVAWEDSHGEEYILMQFERTEFAEREVKRWVP